MSKSRRKFIKNMGVLSGSLLLPSAVFSATEPTGNQDLNKILTNLDKSPLSQDLKIHKYHQITQYNNYSEFSPSKQNVEEIAIESGFKTDPWQLKVSGECSNPKTFSLEDIIKLAKIEQRIFNMRCVEGWSRVVPWNGFALNNLLKVVKPNKSARFVELVTFFDKEIMKVSLFSSLKFPYLEGLRIDEANHPLTTLVLGIAGKPLLPQSGAPVRVVVPWKYGFKGAKSIVEIRLVKDQPVSTWETAQPNEYGFYANVNPKVPHPRWSQSRERPLGSLFSQPTLLFNGFEKQVAGLYQGMDLTKNF